MSQMPPNPYGQPPPPPYGQPPGYPPQGYPQQGFPPPSRTSGTAIASLVLGVLGICPLILIGGLVATLLGIIGIVVTGKPNVRGRGLAISGLILGLLGVLLWSGIAAAGGYSWYATQGDRATARQFVQAIATGDDTTAATFCQPGTTPASLQQTGDQLKQLGALQDTTVVSSNFSSMNGTTTVSVGLLAKFPSTMKTIVMTLTAGPNGKRLIQTWQVQ